jgi:hypothetical protein
MRNLLALAAAGLIGFAGIGWYLGWYRFHTEPTATGRQIQIDLNTPKIKDDVSRGREKLRDFLSDDDSTSNASPNGPSTPNSPVTPAGFQRPSDGNPVNNDPFPPFQAVPPSGSSPKLPSPR